MAKYVLFNAKCRAGGKSYAVGDKDMVDDDVFKQLSRMIKLGKPYVEQCEAPYQTKAEEVKPVAKRGRRKKETAITE